MLTAQELASKNILMEGALEESEGDLKKYLRFSKRAESNLDRVREMLNERYDDTFLGDECPISLEAMYRYNTLLYIANDHIRLISSESYRKLKLKPQPCPISKMPITNVLALSSPEGEGIFADFMDYRLRKNEDVSKNEASLSDYLSFLKERSESAVGLELESGLTYEDILKTIKDAPVDILTNVPPTHYSALELIAKKFPSMLEKLEGLYHPEDLFISNTKDNTSALYWLAGSPDGLKILTALVKHEGFIDKITSEALCARLPSESGPHENTSALYGLAATPVGLKILAVLVKHEGFIDKITPEVLCALRTSESGPHENTSALYGLAATPVGLKILSALIKQKGFIDKITPEALCALRTSVAGKHENLSALYGLAGSPDGREILAVLVKHEGFIDKITPEVLCARLSSEAGKYENTSALYGLAGSPDGREILAVLVEHDGFIDKITPEALCALLSSEAGKYENTSALTFLAAKSSEESQQIIAKLSERPELKEVIDAQEIPPKRRRTFEALVSEEPGVGGTNKRGGFFVQAKKKQKQQTQGQQKVQTQ